MFSQACAQIIVKVLKGHLPELEFEIKAPNDVLARAKGGQFKKVCGLLLDGSISGLSCNPQTLTPNSASYDWLIVGVGLNVNNQLSPELRPAATTLQELAGRPVPRMPLLRDLVLALFQFRENAALR